MSTSSEETAPTPAPKRTVKEFLKQYRALGLPGAKRFRRRTRLEHAAHRHEVDSAMVRQLVQKVARYMRAFEELRKEDNWAVRGEDVLWVGESDPLEIIKKAEVSER